MFFLTTVWRFERLERRECSLYVFICSYGIRYDYCVVRVCRDRAHVHLCSVWNDEPNQLFQFLYECYDAVDVCTLQLKRSVDPMTKVYKKKIWRKNNVEISRSQLKHEMKHWTVPCTNRCAVGVCAPVSTDSGVCFFFHRYWNVINMRTDVFRYSDSPK